MCKWFIDRFHHIASQTTISESLSKLCVLGRNDFLVRAKVAGIALPNWPHPEDALFEWQQLNGKKEIHSEERHVERDGLLFSGRKWHSTKDNIVCRNGWLVGFKTQHEI